MKLPDITLSPKGGVVFKTREAIRALRVANATFYKYRRLLGIEPRKKKGSPCRWYSYQDIFRLMNAIYPLERFLIAGLRLERQEYRERQRAGENV